MLTYAQVLRAAASSRRKPTAKSMLTRPTVFFFFFFLSMISLRRKSTAEKHADKAKSVVILYLFVNDFCLFCMQNNVKPRMYGGLVSPVACFSSRIEV